MFIYIQKSDIRKINAHNYAYVNKQLIIGSKEQRNGSHVKVPLDSGLTQGTQP